MGTALYQNHIVGDSGSIYMELTSVLYGSNDFFSCLKKTLAFLAERFSLDRVSVVYKTSDMSAIEGVVQWTADDVDGTENIFIGANLTGYNETRFYGNDDVLYFDEHSLLIEEFRSALGEGLPKSVVIHTLRCDRKHTGFICLETMTPHLWSKEETEILSFVARLVSEHLRGKYITGESSDNSTKKALDSINMPVYIINRNYDLLYLNSEAKKLYPDGKTGGKCFSVLKNKNSSCRECPIFKIGSDGKGNVCYCRESMVNDISVALTEWNSQQAYVVSAHIHKGADGETALYEKHTRLAEKYAFIYRNACDYLVEVDLITGKYTYTHINNNVQSGILDAEGDYEKLARHIIDTYCDSNRRSELIKAFSLSSLKERKSSESSSIEGEVHIDLGMRGIRYRSFKIFIQSDSTAVISFKDITDHITRQQRDILEKNNLNAAVMAHYPLMISANLTKNTYSLMHNDRFHISTLATGDTLDDCIRFFVGTIHPDDRESYERKINRERITYAFSHGETKLYYEARQKGDDGMYRWIYTRILRIDNPVNDDIHIIYLIRYIDDEKKNERLLKEALKQAESMSNSKTAFLFRMSNEIRSPLREIITVSEDAASSAMPDNMCSSLEKISGVSRSLLSLINNICDMTKLENNEIVLRKDNFEFSTVIGETSDIISPQARLRGISFEITQSGIDGTIYIGDPLRIKQILLNVLSNSVKYTHRGGSVVLDISEQKRAGGYSYIKFTLSDTGIGMSREFLEKMYLPLDDGDASKNVFNETGLGLHITKRLVSLMGGQIVVESSDSSGTVFSIELRFGMVSSESVEYDFTGYRFLVVEDNEMTNEIITGLLKSRNANVDMVFNGDDAVKYFRDAPMCYYDAILMDIVMPGKSGHEATRKIRSLDKLDATIVPIIAMTANDSSRDIDNSFAAGMNEHLVKPVEPQKLFETIRRLLERK